MLTSVLHGDAADEICRRAHDSRAELIVLGRHGERTWRDAVLGNTAERVVRHGSTSTLIATTPSHGTYGHPLVAVDLSASSRLALELAARISRPARREICAVHVTSIRSADDDPALAYMHPDAQRDMVTSSFDLGEALAIGLVGSVVLWVEELRKLVVRRRGGAMPAPAASTAAPRASSTPGELPRPSGHQVAA